MEPYKSNQLRFTLTLHALVRLVRFTAHVHRLTLGLWTIYKLCDTVQRYSTICILFDFNYDFALQ